MITLRCCGEDYHADERHVGRKIMCRKCGRVMTIQTGTATLSAQAVFPSPPAHSPASPSFATAESPPKLMRIIAAAIGGVLVLAGVAALIVVKPSNREPRSGGKTSDSVPKSSYWTPSASPQPQDAPPHEAVTLPTGTWILRPRGARGHSVLKIQNGSDLDSVVMLVTAATPRRRLWMLYVRAHEEKEASGILAGTYQRRVPGRSES